MFKLWISYEIFALKSSPFSTVAKFSACPSSLSLWSHDLCVMVGDLAWKMKEPQWEMRTISVSMVREPLSSPQPRTITRPPSPARQTTRNHQDMRQMSSLTVNLTSRLVLKLTSPFFLIMYHGPDQRYIYCIYIGSVRSVSRPKIFRRTVQ